MGPEFLQRNTQFQPYKAQGIKVFVPEARSTTLIAHATTTALDSTIIKRFSSFTRLKRVVTYCLQFKNNSFNRGERIDGPLTLREINKAIINIIKI